MCIRDRDNLVKSGVLDLQRVKYFGGTSAGSIVATLLASGHTVDELWEIMFETKWNKLKDGNWFVNIFRLFKRFGFHKGQALRSIIDDTLYKKTSKRGVTFSQLYNQTGKHLKMVCTNLTSGKIEYMDHINTPTMPVSQGVQISSCVPFVFEPVLYNKSMYVDGGLIRNLDLNMFSEQNAKVLGLEIKDKFDVELTSITGFATKVFVIIYEEANRIRERPEASVISIVENQLNALHLGINKRELEYLKTVGHQAVHDWLAEQVKHPPCVSQ